MASEFRENLSAVAAFIKETGNVTTTLAAIVGGLGTVVILSVNRIEPGAWAIAVISGTTGLGIAYDPSKSSSIVQQQFQRPVDNVAVSTPSSGTMSNISETFSPTYDYNDQPPSADYSLPDTGIDNDEWLDPTEAAQRMR